MQSSVARAESTMPDPFRSSDTSGSHLCRDRSDYFPAHQFRVSTCSMCLMYLFPTMSEFKMRVLGGVKLLLIISARTSQTTPVVLSQSRPNETEEATNGNISSLDIRPQLTTLAFRSSPWSIKLVAPDVEDEASLLPVTEVLSKSKTQRWLQCCRAAHICCQRQLEQGNSSHTPDENAKQQCPMTWDGYSCVDATPAGTIAQVKCPPFIASTGVNPQARAAKRCLSNGSWWVSEESGMEWTDYPSCLDINTSSLYTKMTITTVCNAISIVLLIPALIVFLFLRSLREQQRIRLHTCLFSTLLVSSVAVLLWERLVIRDMLQNAVQDSFIHSQPNVCTILNLTSRLAKSSSFFWMFCEGFHLYWLLARAFKPINTMSVYMAIGWGIPSCFVVIYLCVRIVRYNTERTMKALLLLVPLLGVQQCCILYRPHVDQPGYFVYEVASALIVNLQVQSSVLEVVKKIRQKLQPAQCDVSRTTTALSLVSITPRLSLMPISHQSMGRESPVQQLSGLGSQDTDSPHCLNEEVNSVQQLSSVVCQKPWQNSRAEENPLSVYQEGGSVCQLSGEVCQHAKENNTAESDPSSLEQIDIPARQLTEFLCQQTRENKEAEENPHSLDQDGSYELQVSEEISQHLRKNNTTKEEIQFVGDQSSRANARERTLHEQALKKDNDLNLRNTFLEISGNSLIKSKTSVPPKNSKDENELVLSADILQQESAEKAEIIVTNGNNTFPKNTKISFRTCTKER
ncbi:hypothetical protein EGW08_017418 [Elysia chlorotica]|uniref:G-protein coupled receptors family 2 profile 2 domain-containing protein n=1 Tax=Elysia chlorotica TaxID=188477 RepID=A0A3S1B8S1_ELYCH|nr:hypothetical protein EGW08_017418 [Elysia chlorotica]